MRAFILIIIFLAFQVPATQAATLLILERSSNLSFSAELADYLSKNRLDTDKLVVTYVDTSLLSLILDTPQTAPSTNLEDIKNYTYDYLRQTIQREVDSSDMEESIDKIIAQGTPAAAALEAFPDLLPRAKRYFLHINWQPKTGVLVPSDFDARMSLQQIIDLYPNTQHVGLIYDPDTWSQTLAQDFYDLSAEFPQLEFHLLDPTWSVEQSSRVLAKMQGDSALLSIVSIDNLLLENIAIASHRYNDLPVFALFPPSETDDLILGGLVVSPIKLAQAILSIARGDILIPNKNLGLAAVYNKRVLDRLHIPMSKLPSDAIVINQPTYSETTIYQLLSGFLGLLIVLIVYHFMRLQAKRKLLELRTLEAEQANENKDTFLANMSHELRTPLNGIYGSFQILLQDDIPRQKIINMGMRSTEALTNILSDILDAQKLKEGRVELNYSWASTSKMIEQILFLYKPLAENKGINFDIACCDSMPAELYCDETRFGQVLHNVIGNAFKFTDKGKIIVSCNYHNERLMINIEDTGIGMSKHTLDHLFERFTQSDSSSTKTYGGTGLGMAITHDLIELMNGKITVESALGKGSSFTLLLPFKSRMQTTSVISSESEVLNPDLTILLVENDLTSSMVGYHIIGDIYRSVVLAENGQHALTQLESHDVDIVITDINMPIMNGKDLLTVLKGTHPNLPVIALTGNAYDSDITEYLGLGFKAVINKPFRRDEVISVINHLDSNNASIKHKSAI